MSQQHDKIASYSSYSYIYISYYCQRKYTYIAFGETALAEPTHGENLNNWSCSYLAMHISLARLDYYIIISVVKGSTNGPHLY